MRQPRKRTPSWTAHAVPSGETRKCVLETRNRRACRRVRDRSVRLLTAERTESRSDLDTRLARQILTDAMTMPIEATARPASVTICPRGDQSLASMDVVANSTRTPTQVQSALAHHQAHISAGAAGGMAAMVAWVGTREKDPSSLRMWSVPSLATPTSVPRSKSKSIPPTTPTRPPSQHATSQVFTAEDCHVLNIEKAGGPTTLVRRPDSA